MRDFKKLTVWQKVHSFTLSIYAATAKLPSSEMYGLTSQLRRAASSIPANIAEGCGRDSDAELGRFLTIAMGSGNEIEYFLLLARDLDYFNVRDYESLLGDLREVKRMMAGLLSRLRAGRLEPGA
jgi:four helix bundle protein